MYIRSATYRVKSRTKLCPTAAHTLKERVRSCEPCKIKLSVADYLLKPIKPEDLVNEMNQMLGEKVGKAAEYSHHKGEWKRGTTDK